MKTSSSPAPISPQMNSPDAIHAPTGNTKRAASSSPPSSNNTILDLTGQSEPSFSSSSSSLSSDNDIDNIITCKHEPSPIDNIYITNNITNKHEADTSNTPVALVDVAAVHNPNSFDQTQDNTATLLAETTRAVPDVSQHQHQHEPQPVLPENASEAVVQTNVDSASIFSSPTSLITPLSPNKSLPVEAATVQPQHVPITPDHDQDQQQQQPSSLTPSSTTSTTTTLMTTEEEGGDEKGQRIAAERTTLHTYQSIFDKATTTSTTATTAEIKTKPLSMPIPVPVSMPSNSSRLSPLDIHAHGTTVADSSSFVPSSSASPSSSSTSSLSDYLIIGQEQVERDDSECDQRSEQSYASSRDSYGERYAEDLLFDEAGQDSHSESRSQTPSPPSSTPSRRDSSRRTSRHGRRSPRPFDKEDEGEETLLPRTFSEGYDPVFEEQEQQRITESASRSSVRIEDEDEETFRSTSRPQSYQNINKAHRRRSHKSAQSSRTEPLTASPVAAAPTATMPVFKLPTIRGLTKSIAELVVASVVCISLISCMFAFSYLSTGATRALGWYSDQQISQRIRDGLKKREHVLQETLEKMAGEEYVKVKRQSRQYHQQQHQYQQQHHTPPRSASPPYGPGGGAYYQNRHQQQYQREREQRQQQQQQQKAYQDDPDRGRLSTAEWQELIRAASVSFMAKWTTATPNPWTSRR
ncbi:hypothetical protein BGW39_002649 [Mortierella sp. 14UC]|nr:hypothetical protein BGW39_002649 [Mortierella sp. 14UC]